MPKQPRFDKSSAGTPGKRPVTGPVWLLLGLAAVLLAAMTRKAYGPQSPTTNAQTPAPSSTRLRPHGPRAHPAVLRRQRPALRCGRAFQGDRDRDDREGALWCVIRSVGFAFTGRGRAVLKAMLPEL